MHDGACVLVLEVGSHTCNKTKYGTTGQAGQGGGPAESEEDAAAS